MQDSELITKAKDTVRHVLNAICLDEAKHYLMGGRFNGSFAKLAETHAVLNGLEVEKVFEQFQPNAERYEKYLEEREANERLLTHCRENGITADGDD